MGFCTFNSFLASQGDQQLEPCVGVAAQSGHCVSLTWHKAYINKISISLAISLIKNINTQFTLGMIIDISFYVQRSHTILKTKLENMPDGYEQIKASINPVWETDS